MDMNPPSQTRSRRGIPRLAFLLALFLAIIALSCSAPALLTAQQTPKPPAKPRAPLSNRQKLRFLLGSDFTLTTAGEQLAWATLDQTLNVPEGWGDGASGFGKRYASSYGETLTGDTINFALAAWAHQDPRYLHSQQTGLWQRAKDALRLAFVEQGDNGRLEPAYSRLIAAAGSGALSRVWYPPGERNRHDMIEAAATNIAADAGLSLWHEFKPDILRRLPFLHHRHRP